MRTLVLGIPLPHVSFDNYSFISAPSLAEYRRIIVQPEAASRVVDEVVSGTAEHCDFSGQPVVNAAASTSASALPDILAMRTRETEWALAHGAVLVCFAYPSVVSVGVTGIADWGRYSWLPAPDAFRYEDHLLPGFGQSGTELVLEQHPFDPYGAEFGARLAYRAVIDETAPNFSDYARVFMRSPGGLAIAAELQVSEGAVVLLPPLARLDVDRSALAETLFQCLEHWRDRVEPNSPERLRKGLS